MLRVSDLMLTGDALPTARPQQSVMEVRRQREEHPASHAKRLAGCTSGAVTASLVGKGMSLALDWSLSASGL